MAYSKQSKDTDIYGNLFVYRQEDLSDGYCFGYKSGKKSKYVLISFPQETIDAINEYPDLAAFFKYDATNKEEYQFLTSAVLMRYNNWSTHPAVNQTIAYHRANEYDFALYGTCDSSDDCQVPIYCCFDENGDEIDDDDDRWN
mgnify:CR=1 FL=1